MKIVTDNIVYVQKKDLDFLVYRRNDIPPSIMLKIFRPGQTCVDSTTKYDFIKFDDELEFNYFNDLDWIIDYSNIKGLSDDEIIELRKKCYEKSDELGKYYKSMDDSTKMLNNDIYEKSEELRYEAQSLTTFLWYRQGDINMIFPEEVSSEAYQKVLSQKKVRT